MKGSAEKMSKAQPKQGTDRRRRVGFRTGRRQRSDGGGGDRRAFGSDQRDFPQSAKSARSPPGGGQGGEERNHGTELASASNASARSSPDQYDRGQTNLLAAQRHDRGRAAR